MSTIFDTMKESTNSHLEHHLESNLKIIAQAKKAIIPNGTRLLVAREELLKKRGNLFLIQKPDSNDLPSRGTILAVGSDVKNPKIQPNLEVYFGRYAGTPVNFEGTEFVLLQENEVLAIYNSDYNKD